MIAFATLLLGLVYGTLPVKVIVSPQVATVEMRLDDASVGVINKEPWEIPVNFGPDPHPHVLEAVARDSKGRTIGKVHQMVNVPRGQGEANILIEAPTSPGQSARARLVWDSALGKKVKKVKVTLDGKRLKVEDPSSFPLPPTDLRKAHVLSAEVFLPGTLVALAATAFGGEIGEQTQTELTAVPLVLGPEAALPESGALQKMFTVDNRPVGVVGAEKGESQVVFIIDQTAREVVEKLPTVKGYRFKSSKPKYKDEEGERQTYFISPAPQMVQTGNKVDRWLFGFQETRPFDVKVMFNRLKIYIFDECGISCQRIAVAVAQAGRFAAGSKRRRAVVLVWSGAPLDPREPSPAAVRHYLEDLHVPLLVWSIAPGDHGEASTPWGMAFNINTKETCARAEDQLHATLSAQRIVWLDGAYLPNRIRLAQEIAGVRLAP